VANLLELDRSDPTAVGLDTALGLNGIRSILKQVASGMCYLHRRCLVHLDLKPDNLVSDEHFNIKLIDFGQGAKCMTMHSQGRVECRDSHTSDHQKVLVNVDGGSPGYVSPERYSADPTVTTRSIHLRELKKFDVFAYGVTAAALCTHNEPFSLCAVSPNGQKSASLGGRALLEAVALHDLKPVLPEGCGDELVSLVERCTTTAFMSRPGFLVIQQEWNEAGLIEIHNFGEGKKFYMPDKTKKDMIEATGNLKPPVMKRTNAATNLEAQLDALSSSSSKKIPRDAAQLDAVSSSSSNKILSRLNPFKKTSSAPPPSPLPSTQPSVQLSSLSRSPTRAEHSHKVDSSPSVTLTV